MATVKIKKISVYHPEKSYSNQDLVEGIENGHKLVGAWEAVGKERRYKADEHENTLTLAIEAAQKVLAESGIAGSDVDMIVVSSGTHEYQLPTDAALVHQAIEGKNKCIIYDQNTNCVGMVVAYDQVCRTMISNQKIKYALLIGSETLGHYYRDSDFIYEGVAGDAACAVILERVEDDSVGFMDSEYFTDSSNAMDLKFPAEGLKKAVRDQGDNKVSVKADYGVEVAYPEVKSIISTLLVDHEIKSEDISGYFVSQLNISVIENIAKDLQEDMKKFKYIGNQYGYTGTTSPFIALHHAIEDGDVTTGDHIVMWSVGAGVTSAAVLLKL
ncbi:3-oxoacyl-[acyl-carrier-protein] synthase III C-terminal domain-containing protein [Paenibacillus sp. An7]|uniref:3-oxoacyl-[acyl-carrier-protein] synthase III C-terminal domain-containing protein n=1 Tax=Paenibacillus sp. An7 TaxID=2689577 RepID=UPI001356A78F|nr:3-oxoacyl-[acyl-carrier-protein] synthase III C-terminal domain-containing protein [Paenibacillus sp. An7]